MTIYFLLTPVLCIAGVVFAIGAGSEAIAISSFAVFHFWSLAGPLVAMELSAFTRTISVRSCHQCGCNLTGNISNRRPECGYTVANDTAYSPPLAERLPPIPWKTHIFRYIAAIVLLSVLLGYRPYVRRFVCTNCAGNKCRLQHCVFVPYAQFELLSFAGRNAPGWQRSFGLTPLLDPDGKCQHNWLECGGAEQYSVYRRYFILRNPAFNRVASEPDFQIFLNDNPTILDRMRTDLANKKPIGDWLQKEYDTWKKQQ